MVPEEIVEKYDKEMDRRTRQNLERFAEFMARMIEKYGHKVLAEMEREEAEKQQGIAFILIYYSAKDLLYYMRFEELRKFWDRAQEGGRKSIRFEELDPRFFLKLMRGCYVPYLDAVNLDLELREELDKD